MENFEVAAFWPMGGFAIGVRCDDDCVRRAEYLLPPAARPTPPQTAFAREVLRQLEAYFADPQFRFDLPLAPTGSETQRRIWRQIAAVAPGEMRAYKQIAVAAQTSPRVVGNACRANPLPLFVPCHRVVAANGIGGFMGGNGRSHIDVKRALLRHETAL